MKRKQFIFIGYFKKMGGVEGVSGSATGISITLTKDCYLVCGVAQMNDDIFVLMPHTQILQAHMLT